MKREPFQAEIDYYVKQTAKTHVPDGDHVISFITFASEVLALVRDVWPASGSAWQRSLEARLSGNLTLVQWREVQSAISFYRVSVGEPYSMSEEHGSQAAISFLFAMAIESPEVPVQQYQPPQLARALDEFSCEFIEHFGRSEEVVQAFRRVFRVADA